MKIKTALIAFTSVLALSVAASAEEGFYVGLGGGANHVHNDKVNNGAGNNSVEFDWGWAGLGTVGYKYDNGLRSELELGYRKNNADTFGPFSADGNVATSTAMLNVLYDFDVSDMVDTYVGVGGGVANVDHNRFRAAGTNLVNDSDTAPAVQGIVGASVAVTEDADAFLNYQYLHAIDTNFKDTAGAKVDLDYDASTIVAGLKFKMYDTPVAAPVAVAAPVVAAAVAAPAPEPVAEPISRTYIVFFDFDKSELTPEAQSVLSQAAADAKAGNAVALKVVGHADRAGTDSYNMALSNRRAGIVKSQLANLGITSGIQTMAKGESDPLIPTEDGVREPQNRRVEVMYVIEPK